MTGTCPPHRTKLESPVYDYKRGLVFNKGVCVKCGEDRDTICPIIDIDSAMPTLHKITKKTKRLPDNFHEEEEGDGNNTI